MPTTKRTTEMTAEMTAEMTSGKTFELPEEGSQEVSREMAAPQGSAQIRQWSDELTLETVLEIWQSTTSRLEQTHLTLQAEVRRLTQELEEKNRQLAKQNRLADLGQMAGHVAHEVRNNLVPMTLYVNLLRRQLSPDPATAVAASCQPYSSLDLITKLESSIQAMHTMVQDLLNFTADRQPQLQPVRLAPLLHDLMDEIRPQSDAQQVQLGCQVSETLNVEGDADMLRGAIRNLLHNALDATGDGGCVQLQAQWQGDHVYLRVTDDGPGIDPPTLARIFDPFFTTKQTGTGLGLSIVERVVECHRGRIDVQVRRPRGTCFTLIFPRPAAQLLGSD